MSLAPPVERLAYSPAELAAALGCSRVHIHNLIRRGELSSIKLGRNRLIPRAVVEALLEVGDKIAAARLAHHETIVDPPGVLDPAERRQLAENSLRAEMAGLALASAKARARKKGGAGDGEAA